MKEVLITIVILAILAVIALSIHIKSRHKRLARRIERERSEAEFTEFLEGDGTSEQSGVETEIEDDDDFRELTEIIEGTGRSHTYTEPQVIMRVMEIIDQINHSNDLSGPGPVWDETTRTYIENPQDEITFRLIDELKRWYNEGQSIGVNWNRLPQSYQNWLWGYIQI